MPDPSNCLEKLNFLGCVAFNQMLRVLVSSVKITAHDPIKRV
jgi:hypothetical protein